MRGSSSAALGTVASGPTASICAEISASDGGTIWAPSPRYTLYPLSRGGLWLAVTCTPAQHPRWVTPNATTGVGSGRSPRWTGNPAAASTAAASRAKRSDRWRAS